MFLLPPLNAPLDCPGGEQLAYGYDCAVGWDPATGLGTPMFDKLLAAAMA